MLMNVQKAFLHVVKGVKTLQEALHVFALMATHWMKMDGLVMVNVVGDIHAL